MKLQKASSRAALAALLGLAALAGTSVPGATPAQAGVYVGIYAPIAPPPPRYEVRPYRPYAGAIWVPGHWQWTGRGHVWVGGYWARPPRRYHNWVPGHWRSTPRGWVWVDGHWR